MTKKEVPVLEDLLASNIIIAVEIRKKWKSKYRPAFPIPEFLPSKEAPSIP